LEHFTQVEAQAADLELLQEVLVVVVQVLHSLVLLLARLIPAAAAADLKAQTDRKLVNLAAAALLLFVMLEVKEVPVVQ
jgi:hypothetical protein